MAIRSLDDTESCSGAPRFTLLPDVSLAPRGRGGNRRSAGVGRMFPVDQEERRRSRPAPAAWALPSPRCWCELGARRGEASRRRPPRRRRCSAFIRSSAASCSTSSSWVWWPRRSRSTTPTSATRTGAGWAGRWLEELRPGAAFRPRALRARRMPGSDLAAREEAMAGTRWPSTEAGSAALSRLGGDPSARHNRRTRPSLGRRRKAPHPAPGHRRRRRVRGAAPPGSATGRPPPSRSKAPLPTGGLRDAPGATFSARWPPALARASPDP